MIKQLVPALLLVVTTGASAAMLPGDAAKGKAVHGQQCVACHGAQGEGGVGPALNNRQVLKGTLDSVFFAVIRSGVPGTQMPAWSVEFGGPLTDEEVRDVVALLRSWEPTAPEIRQAVQAAL